MSVRLCLYPSLSSCLPLVSLCLSPYLCVSLALRAPGGGALGGGAPGGGAPGGGAPGGGAPGGGAPGGGSVSRSDPKVLRKGASAGSERPSGAQPLEAGQNYQLSFNFSSTFSTPQKLRKS